MTQLDDTTLVAYADGELDADSMREVAEALVLDPQAQEKVRLLRESASLVHAAFQDPPYENVPSRLVETINELTAARPRRPNWRIAVPLAASIASAALAFAGGYVLRWMETASGDFAHRLVDEAADYHVVYAREREHQVELSADRRPEIEAWFGRELDRQLKIPDLSAHGLAFRGARLLVVDGHPVAQLLYSRPGDPERPLALCVTKGSQGDEPVKLERRQGVNLAIWQSRGFLYVLVGWDDGGFLVGLSDELTPILDRS